MEAAAQPQAYEHGQTIFGLAVAPPIGGSPTPSDLVGTARLHNPASGAVRYGPIVGSIDVSAFFCEIANKNAVCFGVSA